ncbi:hypothetical protein [Anaerocolumna sp.]|uniref:hypothetical protein n=1 Tax=Anaerocolumna sp. TaxID=2041569 RepID=UPI0028B11719|nr:hypothetical protein [Anaerocolumna sp.]
MGKIQDIEELVEKCEDVIIHDYTSTAKELVDHIISVYSNDIPNYRTGLDLYEFVAFSTDSTISIDYMGDLKKLKAKLINYKYELEEKELARKEALEIQRMNAQGIIIHNDNSSYASAYSNVTITVTLEQTMGKLDKILPKEELNDLEDKLATLELVMKKGDKEKSSIKMSNVLKFIADKGIDVAIAVLPYLCGLAG